MLANLAHFANPADAALELGMVLGSIKRTLLERCATVDGSVAGGADLKLGKLVELDVYAVIGVSLTQSLGLLGLETVVSICYV
jgi:hypothetical protein